MQHITKQSHYVRCLALDSLCGYVAITAYVWP